MARALKGESVGILGSFRVVARVILTTYSNVDTPGMPPSDSRHNQNASSDNISIAPLWRNVFNDALVILQRTGSGLRYRVEQRIMDGV